MNRKLRFACLLMSNRYVAKCFKLIGILCKKISRHRSIIEWAAFFPTMPLHPTSTSIFPSLLFVLFGKINRQFRMFRKTISPLITSMTSTRLGNIWLMMMMAAISSIRLFVLFQTIGNELFPIRSPGSQSWSHSDY